MTKIEKDHYSKYG